MPSSIKTKKYCCVCSNYRGKQLGSRKISLHRFPANDRVKRIWLQRCKLVMKTFKCTKNSFLCSDHFVDRAGPSPINPIPSLFQSKSFRTSKLDENHEDNEVLVISTDERDISTSSDLEDEESLNNEHGFVTSESMLDTSLRVHDYFGQQYVLNHSTIRNQYIQTTPLSTRSIATQTEDGCVVSCFQDVECQTETSCVDASVQLSLPLLTYDDIKSDAQKVLFYTGIPDGNTFDALFDEIKSDAEQRTARGSGTSNGCGGRPRILRCIDEFFMVLMRIRLGLLLEDLAFRFCISTTTCGDIFNRWVDYLDNQLSFLVMWPSRDVIDSNMPEIFRDKFPTTRVIIDATEIRTETPSSLKLKSLMYSEYKSHMTWKSLIGISPAGIVTYVSDLWCGSISDKQLTIESGLVELCEPGDSIMADKGFTISDLTTPRGINLIIPPFKKKQLKFSKHDVHRTKEIANARIHVERQMERIKNFRIVQGVIPITMANRASKIWRLCARLTNLQPPLVPETRFRSAD